MITAIFLLIFGSARPIYIPPQPAPICRPQSDKICMSRPIVQPRERESPLRGRR